MLCIAFMRESKRLILYTRLGEFRLYKLTNIKINELIKINNLTIPEQSITCILGPSGSGKSTLLKVLNNMITPDEGQIAYKKQSISDLDPIQLRRKSVMVPQTPIIFEGTIKDNLAIGSTFSEKEHPSIDEMNSIMEKFKLIKDLNENAISLSGGEKQRLAIARAILMNPEVLLLDEPTSALDEETAEVVVQKILEYVKDKNLSLIFVTHNKELAAQVADYTIDLMEFSLKREKTTNEGNH
jgi:putative ABC transport system ATP-binding protein